MLNKKIIAIIPARAGSKGIKNKNIALVAGIPLISYTINSIKKSSLITNFIVSTDSPEINSIGLESGASNIGLRPEDLSSDSAKTFDAIYYSLIKFQEKYGPVDLVLELQPTYLFRSPDILDNSIKSILMSDHTSFTTVRKILDTSHPDYIGTIIKDSIFFPNNPNGFRRQLLSDKYACIGSIMGAKVDKIEPNPNGLLTTKCMPVILESQLEHIDINSVTDLRVAEQLIKSNAIPKSWL